MKKPVLCLAAVGKVYAAWVPFTQNLGHAPSRHSQTPKPQLQAMQQLHLDIESHALPARLTESASKAPRLLAVVTLNSCVLTVHIFAFPQHHTAQSQHLGRGGVSPTAHMEVAQAGLQSRRWRAPSGHIYHTTTWLRQTSINAYDHQNLHGHEHVTPNLSTSLITNGKRNTHGTMEARHKK